MAISIDLKLCVLVVYLLLLCLYQDARESCSLQRFITENTEMLRRDHSEIKALQSELHREISEMLRRDHSEIKALQSELHREISEMKVKIEATALAVEQLKSTLSEERREISEIKGILLEIQIQLSQQLGSFSEFVKEDQDKMYSIIDEIKATVNKGKGWWQIVLENIFGKLLGGIVGSAYEVTLKNKVNYLFTELYQTIQDFIAQHNTELVN